VGKIDIFGGFSEKMAKLAFSEENRLLYVKRLEKVVLS
jgi:hypothetical protein